MKVLNLEEILKEKSRLKITACELSERSGIPLGTLNKILSRGTKSVKIETLEKLTAALTRDEGEKHAFDGFIKVAACTPRVRLGDVTENVIEIERYISEAESLGIKLVVFPELCLTGYTLSDLFYQQTILDAALKGLKEIRDFSLGKNIFVFVGLPIRKNGNLYNVAAAVSDGKILGITPKTYLPNYNEFYEKRHFKCADDDLSEIYIDGAPVPFGKNIIYECENGDNFTIAAEICEDMWVSVSPSAIHAKNGAFITVNLSCSNEVIGKAEYRRTLISAKSGTSSTAYIYANSGYGESTTDLVFSGHSIIAENGKILQESPLFSSGLTVADIDVDFLAFERSKVSDYDGEISSEYRRIRFSLDLSGEITNRYFSETPFVPQDKKDVENRSELILTMQSTALATRVEHARAKTLVIGVSGGLDSTLALLVAVRSMNLLRRNVKDVIAVTMPCFGTTARTKSNAVKLSESLGVTLKEVDISKAVIQHFKDIGQDERVTDVTYENSQARERTQVLMDIANKTGGMVVGTGDLSELALGWATYNGDHMSMYGVNSSVPKTLIRYLIRHEAEKSDRVLKEILSDVLATPVSPELIPAENGEIVQITENIVGPYILHDFYLYYTIRLGYKPSKIFRVAKIAFCNKFSDEVLYKWLVNFYKRFFAQQFKRSCLPDGVKIGSVSLSPRGDFRMPSDACNSEWIKDLEKIKLG